ncbi:MAG TPA: 5'-methylthioadenosine/adenosylhomocysteine nucleosidase [Azospirillaceae bacterium]|nr:5'-methylthioadenosine/adenosylhomocysteine nucleosidase [Azospirillaceae bacterium]
MANGKAVLAELLKLVVAGDAEAALAMATVDPSLLDARGPNGATPILTAIYYRQEHVARALAAAKPELSLFEACALGETAKVAALLDRDPGAIASYAPDGFFPLALACYFSRQELAEMLLTRGADANQAASNPTQIRPIHSATAARNIPLARLLLSHGADANARQQRGFTPLMAAVQHGQLDMIALLLDHGADPAQPADDGQTPLAMAEAAGNAEALSLLRTAASKAASRPLGIICAIPEEIAHFGGHFAGTDERRVAGFVFRRGLLDGKPAVLVEAGIGKVNAATVATLLLERFDCRVLLFSGVAGGLDPELSVGDVVVGRRLVQHDYGALVSGTMRVYQPGAFPLPGMDDSHGYDLDAGLEAKLRPVLESVELPEMPAAVTGGAPRRPSVRWGTILTGDQFLNCGATRDRLHRDFRAQAVEMEGAAIAQVASRFGVPCLVVRSLSDLAGEESHMDFPQFCRAAAEGASILLRRVAAVL